MPNKENIEVDVIEEIAPKEEKKHPTIDLSSIVDEMVVTEKTKEDKEKERIADEEEQETEELEKPLVADDKPKKPATDDKLLARTVHKTIDSTLRKGAAIIAGQAPEPISPSDEKDLVSLWAEYLATTNLEKLPPWLPLLITIIITYASMYKDAFSLRKKIKRTTLRPNVKQNTKVYQEEKKEDFVVNTDFKIPKKQGRGARPQSEKELVDVIKKQQEELERLAKLTA